MTDGASLKGKVRPVNDLLFRRVLGNAQHIEITKGFISAMLGMEVHEIIIENPYSVDLFKDQSNELIHRNTVVDVLVSLADGRRVVVEMQTTKQTFFLERELFYAASRYTDQYGAFGKAHESNSSNSLYSSLYPVHVICVLDFVLFTEDSDPLSHYVLYDIGHKRTIGVHSGVSSASSVDSLISLSFLELPKPREVATASVRHWMDFFQGRTLDSDAPAYFETACRLVSEQDWSIEEKRMIDYYEISEADRLAQIDYGRQEGYKEGIEQGLELGLEQGLEQGLFDVAKAALLKGSTLEFIADITGLDITDIRKLQAELKG